MSGDHLSESSFRTVARVEQVPPGSARIVRLADREIALFNVEGKFYAIDNVCPHRGGPLGEGIVSGRQVTCPWHAWSFSLSSGVCSLSPEVCVETFPVRVEGDVVQVASPAASSS